MDNAKTKTVIIENNQILFPKVTLCLVGITPEDRQLLFRGLKSRSIVEGFRVMDTRGDTDSDLEYY